MILRFGIMKYRIILFVVTNCQIYHGKGNHIALMKDGWHMHAYVAMWCKGKPFFDRG